MPITEIHSIKHPHSRQATPPPSLTARAHHTHSPPNVLAKIPLRIQSITHPLFVHPSMGKERTMHTGSTCSSPPVKGNTRTTHARLPLPATPASLNSPDSGQVLRQASHPANPLHHAPRCASTIHREQEPPQQPCKKG